MKKKMSIFWITACCIFAAAAAVFLFLRWNRNRITDGPGMVRETIPESVRYTRSGGMLGGFYGLTLCRTDETHALLTVEEMDMHGAPTRTRRFAVSTEALEAAGQTASQYGMADWRDLPASQVMVLDAPMVSVTLTYSDREVYFSDRDELPGEGWRAVSELQDCILSFAKNENSALTLSASGEPASGTLTLIPDSFDSGYLLLTVRNNGESETLFTDRFTLEKQENGVWLTMEAQKEAEETEPWTLPGTWEYRLQCDLNVYGTLLPGLYRVSQNGVSAEFELR